MRTFVVIAGLTIVMLGLAAPPASAAEPIGPVCLAFEAFIETFELFVMPSGGDNFLLTGRNRRDGGPVIGSGRLFPGGGAFLFYFFTRDLTPFLNRSGYVFEGGVNLTAQVGTARYFVLGETAPRGSNDTVVRMFPCS